jgi:hypothetical protein
MAVGVGAQVAAWGAWVSMATIGTRTRPDLCALLAAIHPKRPNQFRIDLAKLNLAFDRMQTMGYATN